MKVEYESNSTEGQLFKTRIVRRRFRSENEDKEGLMWMKRASVPQ